MSSLTSSLIIVSTSASPIWDVLIMQYVLIVQVVQIVQCVGGRSGCFGCCSAVYVGVTLQYLHPKSQLCTFLTRQTLETACVSHFTR